MFVDTTIWMEDDWEDRLDRAIGWLLTALLLFMPLAFGVVEAWSEQVVIFLVGMISVCFLLKPLLAGRVSVTLTWAYVPVAIIVLAIVVQLLPLPQGVVRLISPNTVTCKTELLGDLANAREVLSSMTISFYPHATKHDLRLVLAVVAVFLVVLNVYRRPDQILRLLTTIAVIGAGIAVLALAQNIIGNGKIYWCVTSPHGVAHSGPFVNHSHYGQFMNLSIGAALAVFFVRVRGDFGHRSVTPDAIAEYLGSPDAKSVWGLLGMVVLGATTVFLAMSRGGVISMLFAGALTTLVLSLKKPLGGVGWIIALLALGAFVCVLYIGFDAVYDRLASLRDISHAEGGRWQIIKDVSVAWARFPVLGTGLGTHEVVYPMFDRSQIPALASHAENEYAQMAEEMGLVGLLALVAFGVFVGVHYVRATRNNRQPIVAAGLGLGFGVVAILVHSLSDFGQHMPANAMLTAIFCGLLIRLSRMDVDGSDDSDRPVASVSTRSRWCWGACLAVVGVVWAWGFLAADGARAAEAHWRKVRLAEASFMERRWEGDHDDYIYLLDQAEKAVACEPDNVKYRHWLNVYRWHAISQTKDPNTGEITLSAEALEFVERIVGDLNLARLSCPTFGATWCVLGQLERSVLGRDEDGARHIREGVEVAPCHPTARLVAGMLALEEGETDVAYRHLSVAVALDAQLFAEVASVLIEQSHEPEMALQIAGEDAGHLTVLVRALEGLEESTDTVKEVRGKVVALLEKGCTLPTARAWVFATLARTYTQDGRLEKAIEYYGQALDRDYGRIEWRFSLAQLLAETGAVKEALEEAETCLRFRPGHAASKELIRRLSVDPQSTGGS